MITYHNGDLLNSGCEIIAHQVNLQGVFGGGLALQIAKNFDGSEKYYQDWLKRNKNPIGKFCLFLDYNNKTTIANCFTQDKDFNTNYKWVENCFTNLYDYASSFDIKTIGIPYKYGCGIANGDWNKIVILMEKIFGNEENIDLQIWKLN